MTFALPARIRGCFWMLALAASLASLLPNAATPRLAHESASFAPRASRVACRHASHPQRAVTIVPRGTARHSPAIRAAAASKRVVVATSPRMPRLSRRTRVKHAYATIADATRGRPRRATHVAATSETSGWPPERAAPVPRVHDPTAEPGVVAYPYAAAPY